MNLMNLSLDFILLMTYELILLFDFKMDFSIFFWIPLLSLKLSCPLSCNWKQFFQFPKIVQRWPLLCLMHVDVFTILFIFNSSVTLIQIIEAKTRRWFLVPGNTFERKTTGDVHVKLRSNVRRWFLVPRYTFVNEAKDKFLQRGAKWA